MVISDYQLLKDVLRREETTNRPPVYPFNEVRESHLQHYNINNKEGKGHGIILSGGDSWRYQTNLTLGQVEII